jgi:hypothetical protein
MMEAVRRSFLRQSLIANIKLNHQTRGIGETNPVATFSAIGRPCKAYAMAMKPTGNDVQLAIQPNQPRPL